MKAMDVIPAGVLLLTLAAVGPTYARQVGDPAAKPLVQEAQNKQPQAKGQQHREQQPQAKAPQQQKQQRQAIAPQQQQPPQQRQQSHAQANVQQRQQNQQAQANGQQRQKPHAQANVQQQQQTQRAQANGQQRQKPHVQRNVPQQQQQQQQQHAQAIQQRQKPGPPVAQEQHGHAVEQRSAWQDHRAHNWKSEHRTWQQRGGYNGYRIPNDRYRSYFGRSHAFRIYSNPVVVVGGYPRFQYDGLWFSMVDPWPEYWSDDWYETDDVYIDYSGDGYYLYDTKYPQDRIAVTISVN